MYTRVECERFGKQFCETTVEINHYQSKSNMERIFSNYTLESRGREKGIFTKVSFDIKLCLNSSMGDKELI